MLLRSNNRLTARLTNGILISDNSLSYRLPHCKLRKKLLKERLDSQLFQKHFEILSGSLFSHRTCFIDQENMARQRTDRRVMFKTLITAAFCTLIYRLPSSTTTFRADEFSQNPLGFISSHSSIHTSITAVLPTVQGGRLNKLVKARLRGTCGCQWNHKQGNHFREPGGKRKGERVSERRRESMPSLLVASDHRPSPVSG